jgi:hypothetical protein
MTRRPNTVALVLVMVGATLVAGCQAGPPTSPTAGPSPAPSALAPPPTVATTDPEPASTDPPLPSLPADAFRLEHVFVDGDRDRVLPVVLVDETALVIGLEQPPTEDGSHPDGLSTATPGRPGPDEFRQNGFFFTWMGGACDAWTILRFERVGEVLHLEATTAVRPVSCFAVGIVRSVWIGTTEPVDVSGIELEVWHDGTLEPPG